MTVSPSRADTPLLQVSELAVRYRTASGPVEAVRGADLTVYPGQTVALVGESGSGKSTIALALLGLLPRGAEMTAGGLQFNGRYLLRLGRRERAALRGREIGYVPQDPTTGLNPVWTIGFQVREALVVNGVPRGRAVRDRAIELLGEAGLPEPELLAKRYPHELSGGMRQRVLIALGLAGRPKLLIADEPTSALDVTVQRRILDHLARLAADSGAAVLLITHDLALAAERAEHVVVLQRGRVVESGPAPRLLRTPGHDYTRRLVAAVPAFSSMAARPELPDASAPAALLVEHLSKVFRRPGASRGSEVTAVDDVSFAVRRGTTTALVGESGAGKTTMTRLVLGLLAPTSGRVVIDGVDIAGRKDTSALRRTIQPVFQNPSSSLDPLFAVQRCIEEPLRIHRLGNRSARHARVLELLEQVGLPSSVLHRYPSELSGGQRQRVAIARALALRPEILVCDEALAALDVLVQAQILDLLRDLQREFGLTYLFVTHDLAVVRLIADDVVVMQAGRVVEQGSARNVLDAPVHPHTRELLAAVPLARLGS
jgi:peptide/nickel transport system ATP-binding protein